MAQAHNAAAVQLRSDLQLGQSIAINNRLSAAVKAAKLFPIDSTFIAVSPEYVNYCDSLAVFSDSITLNFENNKRNNAHLLLTKDTIIKLQQNQVANERASYEQCKRDFNSLRNFYAQAESQHKPRNQIYLGAELIGNQYTLIQNVGAVLSLKTKTNKLWQVSGGLQSNGGYYGRINGNFLIRFHKK